MDTEYLKSQLGRCLTDCLTEVSEKRPLDPIEYMGQWLYKYIENINLKKQQATETSQLETERVAFAAEQERQARMAEEKQQLAQEEEERKKAQEAEQAAQLAEDNAAGLATVVEKDEPPEVSGDVHADAEETEEAEQAPEDGAGGEEAAEPVGDGAADAPAEEAPAEEAPPAEEEQAAE